MSLSTQYLEELSRRYKKQMEEMQRLFDKTLNTLNIESKQKDEHKKHLETELKELKRIVDDLVMERSNWTRYLYSFVLVIIMALCFIKFFRRTFTNSHHSGAVELQRRNSVGVISHQKVQKKQRRPSEEALKIKGSYKELMVDDVDGYMFKSGRKRKKRKESPKPTNFSTLSEEKEIKNATEGSPVNVDDNLERTATINEDWVESNAIKDVPVVLEDSEHTFLEFTPLVNGDITDSPSFMKTATKSRLNRSTSQTPLSDTNGNQVEGKYKKSVSVDATCQMESVNGNVMLAESTSKKEKKGLFKIFKKK